MRRFPEIFETIFGDPINNDFTKRDAALNSRLLETICRELLKVELGEAGFGTGRNWRIRVTDTHDIELEPHYVLDVGERGKIDTDPEVTVKMRYVDNWSAKPSTIEQAYGTICVQTYGDFGLFTPEYVAKNIAYIYSRSLKELFPDYYIHVDQAAYEV